MRTRMLAGLALLIGSGALAAPLSVTSTPVTLAPTGVEFAGAVALRSGDTRLGGLSGVDVSPDGARFVALTDAGRWVTGDLIRRNGRLVDVRVRQIRFMPGPDGAELPRVRADSEGLSWAPGGGYLVSFERINRIARYGRPGELTDEISLEGWNDLPANAGLEALATDAGGRILAIAETTEGAAHPAWLIDGDTHRALTLPAVEELSPTGATFGPDGALWLVSRRFSWLGGFRIALDRLTLTDAGFSPRQRVMEITAANGSDNFEGVDVWRDGDGRLRATLVADDNFNIFQKTIFLEVLLPD